MGLGGRPKHCSALKVAQCKARRDDASCSVLRRNGEGYGESSVLLAFPEFWLLLVEKRAEQGWVWVEVGVDVGSGLQPLPCGGKIKAASASLSASCSSSRPPNLRLI